MTLSIYGRQDKVRLVEGQGCWHSQPDRLLSMVAVEALSGGRPPQAFYCTASSASGVEILQWYARRWSQEVTFHDVKQELGFAEPQGWSRQAVLRTAPLALLLYSLIVYWFLTSGHRCYQSSAGPWYRKKVHPSFAEMLATLKREHLKQEISERLELSQGSNNLQTLHERLIQLVL